MNQPDPAWETSKSKLAAAEAVVEAAEAHLANMTGKQRPTLDGIRTALANYHKATGPQAENEDRTTEA